MISATENAHIQNLRIEDYDITGGSQVGPLVGQARNSTFENIFTEGTVRGWVDTGGITGILSEGSILKNSETQGTVLGRPVQGRAQTTGGVTGTLRNSEIRNVKSYAEISTVNEQPFSQSMGGIAGAMRGENPQITYSYFDGEVNGQKHVGGIVGVMDNGRILDSYSRPTLNFLPEECGYNGCEQYKAGGIAAVMKDGTINRVWTITSVPEITDFATKVKPEYASALVGEIVSGEIRNSYWHAREASKGREIHGWDVQGLTGQQFRQKFTGETEWNMEEVWKLQGNVPELREGLGDRKPETSSQNFQGEGEGTESNPYRVNSVQDLSRIRLDKDAYYEITEDIDASSTRSMNNISGDAKGFEPITGFEGYLDGNGHTISDLYINRPKEIKVGLFGTTTDAKIKSIRMEDFSIRGKRMVGGLVGYGFNKEISYCSLHGRVGFPEQRAGNNLGGIAGQFRGRITDCKVIISHFGDSPEFSTGDQIAIGGFVGTLIGDSFDQSVIKNSYVDVNESLFGAREMIGVKRRQPELDSLYTVAEEFGTAGRDMVRNQNSVEGVNLVQRNASENVSSYPGLDFEETWKIEEGVPALKYEDEDFPGYSSGYSVEPVVTDPDYGRPENRTMGDNSSNESSDGDVSLGEYPEPFVSNKTTNPDRDTADPARVLNDIGFAVYQILNSLLGR